MTDCPACRGTGRTPAPRLKLIKVAGRPMVRPVIFTACRACGGSGKLVDVLLR